MWQTYKTHKALISRHTAFYNNNRMAEMVQMKFCKASLQKKISEVGKATVRCYFINKTYLISK